MVYASMPGGIYCVKLCQCKILKIRLLLKKDHKSPTTDDSDHLSNPFWSAGTKCEGVWPWSRDKGHGEEVSIQEGEKQRSDSL